MSISREIITLSHLVYSVDDLEAGLRTFEPFGYSLKKTGSGTNPQQKAPFVKSGLCDSYELSFLTTDGQRISPPIELLKDNGVLYRDRVEKMYMIFSTNTEVEEIALASELRALVDESKESSVLVLGKKSSGPYYFHGLLIRCSNIRKTLAAWSCLGFSCEEIHSKLARMKVSSLLSRNNYLLYFSQEEMEEEKCMLDGKSLVCFSFLVKDLEAIRARLMKEHLEVGECFNLKPFGKEMKAFFARNVSGELYEFLSPQSMVSDFKRSN